MTLSLFNISAEMALGVLDPQFKPNMTKDEAIKLAKHAVRAAALRDSASGGLNCIRLYTQQTS